ncbi:MAG: hypothetical protein AB7V04_12945 [Desulfomonilaceae bacterium]
MRVAGHKTRWRVGKSLASIWKPPTRKRFLLGSVYGAFSSAVQDLALIEGKPIVDMRFLEIQTVNNPIIRNFFDWINRMLAQVS